MLIFLGIAVVLSSVSLGRAMYQGCILSLIKGWIILAVDDVYSVVNSTEGQCPLEG